MRALLTPFRLVADFALPPRCAGCGALTGADHRFCATCWQALRFLGPPRCAGCRVPFAFDRGEGALCGACLEAPPPHAGTLAAVAYGPVARRVALQLKYGGRAAFAETAARMMARLLPADAEVLVPVPLDRWRLWGRGYNQAALIADALSRLTGVPTVRDALVRTRGSGGMRGLNLRQRRQAVRGAFAVARPEAIAGRSVIVIDDVQATGATVAQCARVLSRVGRRRSGSWYGRACWKTARRLDGARRAAHIPLMAQVEIYTKAFCPYCTRALHLLAGKGVSPTEYDITMGGPKRAEMIARADGRTTVPQVFIDGRHIGGSDDLAALDRAGKLDPLLTA